MVMPPNASRVSGTNPKSPLTLTGLAHPTCHESFTTDKEVTMRFARVFIVTVGVASFLMAFILIAGSTVVGRAQSDPVIGTWRLNLMKSTYNPGPPPKNLTRTYEAVRNGVKVTVEGVDGSNNRIQYGYTANYDGKDYSMTGMGVPGGADLIALTRVDIAFTVEETLKQAGKVIITARRVVSQNGRVLTFNTKGTPGQPFNNVTVYDKQ